jgi:predicted transcriptional regulator
MKAFLPGIVLCALLGTAFFLGSNRELVQKFLAEKSSEQNSGQSGSRPPNRLPNFEAVTDLSPVADAQIVQAQALVTRRPIHAVAEAATLQPPASPDKVKKIIENGYAWNAPYSGTIYLKANVCDIEFADNPGRTAFLDLVKNLDTSPLKTIATAVETANSETKATLTFLPSSLGSSRSVSFIANGPSYTFVIPKSTNSPPPQIVAAVNGDYKFPDENVNAINVYNGFLKVKIRSDASIQRLNAVIFKTGASPKIAVAAPIPVRTSISSTYVEHQFDPLTIPAENNSTYEIFLYAEYSDGNSTWTPNPLVITVGMSNPDNSPTAVKVNDSANAGLDFRVRHKRIVFHNFKIPGDAQAAVYSDANGQAPIAVLENREANELAASSVTATKGLVLPDLPDGTYQFSIGYRRGGREISARSSPITIRVKTRGPTASVTPTTLGSSIVPEIVVRFSEQLDPKWKEPDTANNSKTLLTKFFVLSDVGEKQSQDPIRLGEAKFADNDNSVVRIPIVMSAASAGDYRLRISGQLTDIFGNKLEGNGRDQETEFVFDFTRGVSVADGQNVSLGRGITTTTGNFVTFPEFTKFRKSDSGFNPGDHVETRVVRLYYFRDAHRVAQIINRNVKSFNTPAIAVRERLADQSRDAANVLTDQRRAEERAAVVAAEASRIVEHQLASTQRELTNARAKAESDKGTDADKRTVADLERRVASIQGDLQNKRQAEIVANEKALSTTAAEDRKREEQFRRQTAAARTDPDTYVAGVPDSKDPVEQVSISVIGEATIQLRGPTSGMNVIRKMIHEIDAPVGQVRIAMHTVQVNGEHGDRMEKVVGKIQDYIDQSRFLTVTSALMLRKAIVRVASQRALAAQHQYPEASQEARNERYLYAFFGKDFIEELKALDSEFLRTGNKLLSLNSMDTTSLASGLFVLALAKNTTRQEILAEFRRQLECELPQAELSFIEEGGYRKHHRHIMLMAGNAKFQTFFGFFDADILGDDTLTPMQREFIRLAQIFKSQLVTELELRQRVTERALLEDRIGDDIEVELRKQKDKEDKARGELESHQRSLTQQLADISSILVEVASEIAQVRVNNEAIDNAVRTAEQLSSNIIAKINNRSKFIESVTKSIIISNPNMDQESVIQLRKKVENGVDAFISKIQNEKDQITEAVTKPGLEKGAASRVLGTLKIIKGAIKSPPSGTNDNKKIDAPKQQSQQNVGRYLLASLAAQNDGEQKGEKSVDQQIVDGVRRIGSTIEIPINSEQTLILVPDENNDDRWVVKNKAEWSKWISDLRALASYYDVFALKSGDKQAISDAVQKLSSLAQPKDGIVTDQDLKSLYGALDEISDVGTRVQNVTSRIEAESRVLVESFRKQDGDIQATYAQWLRIRDEITGRVNNPLKEKAIRKFGEADQRFLAFLKNDYLLQVKLRDLAQSRRPLDHKKFLDLLIDEMQDKYVELLEGTRSYLANIDDYIKRVATALEDDFNTQFNFPAFREVRQASRMWDVTLGQIETTSILTNNRGFGKVEPQATMEFDLPRRDIFVTEAMKSSKAAVETYGALLQDPTFIALTKLNSGMPTSSPPGGYSNGMPVMRNVLPGLSRSSDEQMLSQGPPATRSGASPLDQLIPDPAIYKFETGTGYEVRPVIGPDGQSVTFHLNYMYTTNVREPVRADEKHLGRVKRHFIDTDVQIGNYELREVSRYQVALKASRTAKGVPLLQDIPGVGILFRPLPSAESALQQNIIYSQAVIYPTLYDLMGLRWAPVVADLDPLALRSADFVVRNRRRYVMNRVFDTSTGEVDNALRIPENVRRGDLYRAQETIPYTHPNGYQGPGFGILDSQMRPGYDAQRLYPQTQFWPTNSINGVPQSNGVPQFHGVPPMNGMPPSIPGSVSPLVPGPQSGGYSGAVPGGAPLHAMPGQAYGANSGSPLGAPPGMPGGMGAMKDAPTGPPPMYGVPPGGPSGAAPSNALPPLNYPTPPPGTSSMREGRGPGDFGGPSLGSAPTNMTPPRPTQAWPTSSSSATGGPQLNVPAAPPYSPPPPSARQPYMPSR